jgi:phosphoglycerate dehydrogenase-like enzyme
MDCCGHGHVVTRRHWIWSTLTSVAAMMGGGVEPRGSTAAAQTAETVAAALDVVATEPLAKGSSLLGRADVILMPHTAFYSVEALEELQTKCASDVARVLSGEKPIYPFAA